MSLKKTAKKLIAKVVKTKTIEFQGMTITGAFEDYGVLKAINNNTHEVHFQQLFTSSIQAGMTVLDVGAHLGKYSLLAAQKVGDTGKVVSFEPHPRTFSYLKTNIADNKVDKVTSIHNAAISDVDGTGELNADLVQSDFTSMAAVRHGDEVETIQIKTTTISAVDSQLSPDVCKVDVEGAELLVLKGIQTSLDQARAQGKKPKLFIEANRQALSAFNESPTSLYQAITECGFSVIKKIDENNLSLTQVNLEDVGEAENWLCT